MDNKEIIMSNKKYKIISDKLKYIDCKMNDLINDMYNLKIQIEIVKEYLTEDLIN